MRRALIVSAAIILLFATCFSVSAHDLSKNELPRKVYKRAIDFCEVFLNANHTEAYSYFDEKIKNEIELGQLESLMTQLGNIGREGHEIEFKRAEYRQDNGGFYILLFHIITVGPKIEYIVSLKNKENGIFVQGFNFKTIPMDTPSRRVDLKDANALQYFILFCFILCVAIQIWCLIFFMRKKGLKKKWLYIISSFIGFPMGIGTRWATSTVALNFGFKIPAVAVSWPLGAPEMWSISVFFPIGLVAMIIVKARDVDQYALVSEEAEIMRDET